MNLRSIASLLFLLLILIAPSLQAQTKIIFDTDFGGDADDLGALAMLHYFIDTKEADLLAIMSWSHESRVVSAIDAVNRYYGHPDIPIGIRSHDPYQEDWHYTGPLADQLPHQKTNSDAPLAVDLYRQILAAQPDQSVKLVTVGPLKNIQDLIQSKPDQHSPLTGLKLMEQKINEMVVMGGKFPAGENEWNFDGGMSNVTQFVFEKIDIPVVFSGYEIGFPIKTGAAFNDLANDHPLYLGWMHFSKNAPWMKENFEGKILDNASYDQTAILYAVKGGIGNWWDKKDDGYLKIEADGDNQWVKGESRNQSYLVLRKDPDQMADLIESIMLHRK